MMVQTRAVTPSQDSRRSIKVQYFVTKLVKVFGEFPDYLSRDSVLCIFLSTCLCPETLPVYELEETVGSHDSFTFSQNAELLSSLESASVRIFKPPTCSTTSGALRFYPSDPQQTSAAPVGSPGPAPLDSPRMATIKEDPSLDSHLDEEALQEAFGRPEGSAPRSFEDLTDKSVTGRSDKAMLFRLKRQHQIDSKETQC